MYLTSFLRPLAATAVAAGVATLAVVNLPGEPAPVAADVKPAVEPKPSDAKATAAQFAVEPKPLSDAVKKGLKFLADRQQKDGGWNQGGGWRTGGKGGGRVEDGQDPSDVGNTCIALLAFARTGSTATEGEYKEHIQKGIKFLCEKVEKADAKDMYVTDVRDTQLQSKIGPFVDTFFTTLVLAELKGKAGDDEKRLVAALDKTIDKIAKNQKEDGNFANNGGWAPTLSLGVCNKALSRARQNGAKVGDQLLARAATQSSSSLKAAGPAAPAGGKAEPSADSFTGRGGAGLAGDAGVKLYSSSQGAGNLQDVLNVVKLDADKAREVLRRADAKPEEKAAATKKIEEVAKLEKQAGEAREAIAKDVKNQAFVAGFGNNGGEEFLSFLNISEMMVVKADKDWKDWDGKMQEMLPKGQDKDGGWSGQHCITGRTFCTAGALLVLMADRTPFPADVLKAAREEAKPKAEEKK